MLNKRVQEHVYLNYWHVKRFFPKTSLWYQSLVERMIEFKATEQEKPCGSDQALPRSACGTSVSFIQCRDSFDGQRAQRLQLFSAVGVIPCKLSAEDEPKSEVGGTRPISRQMQTCAARWLALAKRFGRKWLIGYRQRVAFEHTPEALSPSNVSLWTEASAVEY